MPEPAPGAAPRRVAVEGPIAVGKSTLAGRLAARLGAELILEAPHENPFLGRFYREPDSAALPAQLFFLLQRVSQHCRARQGGADSRQVWDYLIDKDGLFAAMTLASADLELYRQVYHRLVDAAAAPDVVVFLRAPVPVLLERLRRRARDYERDVGADYLARVAAGYDTFFARYDAAPVLVVDTEGTDLARDAGALEALAAALQRPLSGRRRLDLKGQATGADVFMPARQRLEVIHDKQALRARLAGRRAAGASIALVPTMGNLHAGHRALVEAARRDNTCVVASVFVNPTQFLPGEDYETYPRTLEADRAALEAAGADLLYAPGIADLYPDGLESTTRVEVPALDGILCGASRPGHFTGVATVVSKLFNIVQPERAYFGDKDYQQLLVLRRMARDLAFPVEVCGVPTVREPDGLAMSSRNAYLSEAERRVAPALYRALERLAAAVQAGAALAEAEQEAFDTLAAAGFSPEYVSVRRAADLAAAGEADRELAVLAAARLGTARLIDHLEFRR